MWSRHPRLWYPSSPSPRRHEEQHTDSDYEDVDQQPPVHNENTGKSSINSDVNSSKVQGQNTEEKVSIDLKFEPDNTISNGNSENTSVDKLLILCLAAEKDFSDHERTEKKKKKKRKYTMKKDRPTLLWEIWEEEHERWIDENLTEDVDINQQNAMLPEAADVPSDLIMSLLRYQKEWLAWALKQEDSTNRGGILADEMGMGKTIQAIALVLTKQKISTAGENTSLSTTVGPSTSLPHIRGTLVICPVVAMSQWASEIDRFTRKGSTEVLIYHGPNREKSAKQLSEYDFVITSYSIVEAEYRKNVMPHKEKCCYCGKSYKPDKLKFHLKYSCGPHAIITENQSKQQRKLSKNISSKSQRETKTEVALYTGSRKRSLKQQTDEDDSDFIKENLKQVLLQKESLLHSVMWERLILDEAHFIKDRGSSTTKAVLALESSYKWALSGTPLQNRVGELYALVRFLRIVPFSYYLCKDCDCRTLDYSPSTECSGCPHSSVRHFCWWNKHIGTPIQKHPHLLDGKRAMILLKHRVLKNIVLRRTKRERASDLALPPRIVKLRRDLLDAKEEDYYESLYKESRAQFKTYVQAGTVMNNYAHIFDLLTRLRQAVNHPYLVVYSRAAALNNENIFDNEYSENICGICCEPAEDPVVTSCDHVFCKACLLNFSASSGKVPCPSCVKSLAVDVAKYVTARDQTTKTTLEGFKSSSILNRIQLENFQTSTKIEALREEIRYMVERDGSAKGIVFSQFTSFLDLINYSLQKSGISCVQLVGSMSVNARDSAIKKFIEDPGCKIFLISLKAGGIALNLTVASHVFLMDPWWNPAMERQAQDRIHRIGQYKPIWIVKFVIENTIEERVLKLQEKKELVFEGTVGGSNEAFGKLTEADIRFLFS